jgi:hypothetical protein
MNFSPHGNVAGWVRDFAGHSQQTTNFKEDGSVAD